MCALCGVLGSADHWTDPIARPGVFSRNWDAAERRRERMRRVQCANRLLRLYGLKLSDWQGSAFLLSTATGRTEIVDHLAHLWIKAEALTGRLCDPLDPVLITRLEAADG